MASRIPSPKARGRLFPAGQAPLPLRTSSLLRDDSSSTAGGNTITAGPPPSTIRTSSLYHVNSPSTTRGNSFPAVQAPRPAPTHIPSLRRANPSSNAEGSSVTTASLPILARTSDLHRANTLTPQVEPSELIDEMSDEIKELRNEIKLLKAENNSIRELNEKGVDAWDKFQGVLKQKEDLITQNLVLLLDRKEMDCRLAVANYRQTRWVEQPLREQIEKLIAESDSQYLAMNQEIHEIKVLMAEKDMNCGRLTSELEKKEEALSQMTIENLRSKALLLSISKENQTATLSAIRTMETKQSETEDSDLQDTTKDFEVSGSAK